MMESKACAIALGIGLVGTEGLLAAAVPLVRWDFEKTGANGHVLNVAPGRSANDLLGGELRPGFGVDGSAACHVGPGTVLPQRAYFRQLPIGAFTFDLSFRLDDAVDPKEGNSLLSCSWNSWGRGNLLLAVTPRSELSVRMRRPQAKDGTYEAVDFQLLSKPQELSPGVYHSVRLERTAEGRMNLHLDGRTVASRSNAPSFEDIRCPAAEAYPLLQFGADDRDPARPKASLRGCLDDIAVYDSALGKPEPRVAHEDYSRVAPVEFRKVAETPDDVLIPDAAGRVTTGPFEVLDKEEELQGNWVRAENKFVKAAARATMALDEKTLRVTIDCPIPPGMELKKSTHGVWSGDEVEFFVRPDLTRDVHYQYCVNAAGLSAALRHGGGGGFKSKARMSVREKGNAYIAEFVIPREEVFADMPRAGSTFSVNFARTGDTAGGISTWAKVGTNLNSPSRFGKVLWGGAKPYFDARLEKSAAVVRSLKTPAARAAGQKAFAPLAAAVRSHGASVESFASLERLFAAFDQAVSAISLGGRPLVVYTPRTPWGDDIEPGLDTAQLTEVRLVVARNSKTWHPVAVRNMSERDFIGQVKVFDSQPDYAFGFEDTCGVARGFTVLEAVAKDLGSGVLTYDPLAQLPMNSLLRLPARHTTVLWLRFDSQGFEPGRHFASFVVKRATEGFEILKFPMVVDIRDADLDTVPCPRAGYTTMANRSIRKPCAARLAARRRLSEFQEEIMPGTIYLTPWNGAWPKYDDGGRLGGMDFADFDAIVDARLAAGARLGDLRIWYFCALNRADHVPRLANGTGARFGTPEHAKGLAFAIASIQKHMKGKYGLGKDRLIVYTVDEPSVTDAPDDPACKTPMAKAYRLGKILKAADPETVTFTNPHSFGPYDVEKFGTVLERLSECYDILEFYRPNLTPGFIDKAKSLPFKELWTYSIWSTKIPAVAYCGDPWKNMRDGFNGLSTYWHIDEHAGRDGFDPTDKSSAASRNYTDYGSVYVDYDNGYALTSRRQVAHDLAHEDVRLVGYLRRVFAGDPAKLSRIESVVREAADTCTMPGFEKARRELFDMLP